MLHCTYETPLSYPNPSITVSFQFLEKWVGLVNKRCIYVVSESPIHHNLKF